MREFVIIGLTGVPGSGKDTASEVLSRYTGAHRVALADPLKRVAEILDPLVEIPIRLGGLTLPGSRSVRLSRALRHYGWDRLKRMAPDVRRLLQRIGTEVGRDFFGESVWVDRAWMTISEKAQKIWSDRSSARVVITIPDIRFLSEWHEISRNGLSLAALLEADYVAELWEITRPGFVPVNSHASENYSALWGLKSRTISNAGDLDHFASLVEASFEKSLTRRTIVA